MRPGFLPRAAVCALLAGAAPLDACARQRAPAAPAPVPLAPSAAGAGATDSEADARLAAAVLEEVNRARTDPVGYARLLEAMLPQFDERVFRRPERPTDVLTVEGAAAVREAIRVLRATAPRKALRPSRGLALAARDLVRDQASHGGTGHVGAAGDGPAERARRHGRWEERLTENIMYGAATAREVVTGLLVDDGVPGRGHRRNLLDPLVAVAGAACGPHPKYRRMCVIDHASAYVEASQRPSKGRPRH